MKRIICNILLLFIAADLFAQERELIAKVEVPNLMQSTENLSRLSEKIQPGSAGYVVMGVTALSFYPKFKNIDISGPVQLCYYGNENKEKKKLKGLMEWCIIADKKGKRIPPKIKFKKIKLYTSSLGDRALLCGSKGLAKALKDLPQFSETRADINIELKPRALLVDYPDQYQTLKQFIIDNWVIRKNKAGKKKRASKEKLQKYEEDILFYENIFKQLKFGEFFIYFQPEQLHVTFSLKPESDSEVAKTLKSASFIEQIKSQLLIANEEMNVGLDFKNDELKGNILIPAKSIQNLIPPQYLNKKKKGIRIKFR